MSPATAGVGRVNEPPNTISPASRNSPHAASLLASLATPVAGWFSTAVTGLPANYLRASFEALGVDVDNLPARDRSSFAFGQRGDGSEAKAWLDVWSAGQGVAGVEAVLPAREIIDRMACEYLAAQAAAIA